MKDYKIKLGDKVRDKITGYIGIATARTLFLNGCVQYSVTKKLKIGETIDKEGDPSIDERCLEIVEERVIESKEYEDEDEDEDDDKSNGGPTKFMKRMRGY
jgi:hypothetical protein